MSDIPAVPFASAPAVVIPTPAAELIDGGQIGLQAAALEARLQAAFPARQFTHRFVPARLTLQAWSQLTQRLPMVGLGFVRVQPASGDNRGGKIWNGEALWTVFLMVKNPDFRAQLLGDRTRVGTAGMIAVAMSALHGMTIDGAGTVRVDTGSQAYDEAWIDETVGMAAITLTIPCRIIDQAGLQALDDFLRIGMHWPTQPDLDDVFSGSDTP